ncbi:GspE/PulE family protein [Ideonella azotifigens]|uniref:Bacterial type II secretion system protein E domain-containing protein n=1 Tax=Ideonella azotifigens TaxID=513160 RepID=A0ABP3VWV7_9BURK|nr:GspE/PulE family protein [Ideonella azotifigens]MCD2345013.1 GspE/PulE family protein [Ideonella azotifigens]
MSSPKTAPVPTASAVLAELSKARAADAGTVLDALRRQQPGWPWEALLPAHSGVRTSAGLADLVSLPTRLALPVGVAIVREGAGISFLAMADPWDDRALQRASAILGQALEPLAASADELARWHVLLDAASGAPAFPGPASAAPATSTSAGSANGSVIVDFVDRALLAAWRTGASDVHFECDRQGLTVKHRLDGVMAKFERLEGFQLAEEVISRLKVLSQLDITERRLPQDGRFRFRFEGREVDLRVSIMPSVFGEDAVLRLLDKSTLRSKGDDVTLDALGFDADSAFRLRHLARLPHGMLLVTGPTGSGKTTSVYAALSEINTGLEKIITIEDPVEYELPGVLQIPVNEKKGLTFARGLRSILRHDPDRILVGEIRDGETAEIAVQSALTGHLVFTTVHANSLFDVIGRFRHFGLDMFGFVSSLNGVVVQRLMRRLCQACATSAPPSAEEAAWWARHEATFGPMPAELPRAQGCQHCHGTGYRGRFVIAEVHVIGDHLRDRILGGAEVTELKRLAFEGDVGPAGKVQPLLQQAIRRIQQSQSTLEELFRVVGQV